MPAKKRERQPLPTFDPGAAAPAGSGIFGLPIDADAALVHLIPVAFEATTSYRGGTSKGPKAILDASRQVDLFDVDCGRPYEPGICLLAASPVIKRLNHEAKRTARPVIAAGGDVAGSKKLRAALQAVNEASAAVNDIVRKAAETSLAAGKLVGVLGGDHAAPFGLIEALAARFSGMGILHVDAHHDLREAYEGFTWSHASIMHNVMTRIPGVAKLVQVGIRDFSEAEKSMAEASGGRIVVHYDQSLALSRIHGRTFADVARSIIDGLPQDVYVSFDIDGLDPALCPNTGTPVPGGLSFNDAVHLLRTVVASGRRIVGFDLCEVAPGTDEWDANVGARLLYKLIGFTLQSHGR